MASSLLLRSRLDLGLGLLLLGALSVSYLPLTSAADAYCDGAYLFFPDGRRLPGTGDWSSIGKYAAFHQGPCTGVSGISMTQTYLKNVLIIDRSASDDGHITLADAPDKKAYAQEIDIATGAARPLNIITNTFCSSAQHFADGTLVNIGGDYSPDTDYVTPGGFSVRSYKPCTDSTCDFKIIGQTLKVRWYPTTQLLPDGRMIIIGGATNALGINTPKTNVPFIEYYPRRGAADVAVELDFLTATMPYNLFPFCHLLPSGLLFIFSGNQYILFNTATNAPVLGNWPKLDVKDAEGYQIFRQYPLSATSAMLPLQAKKDYAAEIIICGGSTTRAQNPETDDPFAPADNMCWRIAPEAPVPTWTPLAMRFRRVMPIAVLLPDGHVLIHGGAAHGHTGFWNMAHNGTLIPELYNSYTYKWNPLPLPASKVPRGYHASAQLLHSGAVMISGSNTADGTVQGPIDFPTEFRVEYFHPPYMMPGQVRPVLLNAPKAAPIKLPLVATFAYRGAVKSLKVVLAHPGFSTHGANHGMRNVELLVVTTAAKKGAKGVYMVKVAGCPSKNICPPTFYWLFVVVNGIPNGEGHFIFVR